MNKQKLSLGLSLVLVLSSSLVVTSNKANAGPGVVLGTPTDSSGVSGDSFVPGNAIAPGQFNQLLPGVNLEIDPRGQIIVPPEVQNTVNNVASDINNQTPAPTPDNCLDAIAAVFRGGFCEAEGKLQIQSTLESYKISQESIKAFIESITGLLANNNVDITRLNFAINNWNSIVKQFNSGDLSKAKNDPNLGKLTSNLKQLRAALRKAR